MFLTWTALHRTSAGTGCPWLPEGADFVQAGEAGAGRAELPAFDGSWWSVLACWPDEAAARASAPPAEPGVQAWHVVLQAASFRGDARLAGGAQPFPGLPEQGRTTGASVVLTLAGTGADPGRTREFFRRFVALGRDVRSAPGHLASLVQAPADGAALTFTAWESLRDALAWAYRQPLHAAALQRQEEHGLLETGGFLRCAVLASSGSLGGAGDPLAGRTGTVVAAPALAPG